MRQRILAMAVTLGVVALACSDSGVGPPSGNDSTPAALNITGATQVDIKGTAQLSAQARNAAGQTVSASVSWSSSDVSVATVDNAGNITGVARGNATIQAQVQGASGPVTDTHAVTVRIASISLTPATSTLQSLGDTLLLTAEAKDAIGATVPGVTIGFQSSDAAVASVTSGGAVVAVGNGQAVVTASGDSRSQQATVTVSQAATGLTMTASVDTLTSLGDTLVYTASATDARGNSITSGFSWTATNAPVASIAGSGSSVKVTATGNGTTGIQVGRDGFSANATLVVRQVVAEVAVTPATVSVLETMSAQVQGAPRDARGNVVAGRAVSWISDDEAVATVDVAGVVTGVAAGSATITATSDGVSGTASATVTAVSLSQNVQPILTANCALSGCHTGPSPAMGQNLSAGQTFANTVNVASGELPTMDRVEPGDPDQSYLVHKIQGTQASVGGSGARMPLGGTPLSQAQIDVIRAWVKKGAPNN